MYHTFLATWSEMLVSAALARALQLMGLQVAQHLGCPENMSYLNWALSQDLDAILGHSSQNEYRRPLAENATSRPSEVTLITALPGNGGQVHGTLGGM